MTKMYGDDFTNEELFEQFKRTGDSRIRDELVMRNQNFIGSVVNKYYHYNPYLTRDDAMSFGNIGFLKGLIKFNPNMGVSLLTFIYYYVRKAIIEGLQNEGSMVRVPKGVHSSNSALKKIENNHLYHEMEQQLNPLKLVEWMCDEAGLTLRDYAKVMIAREHLKAMREYMPERTSDEEQSVQHFCIDSSSPESILMEKEEIQELRISLTTWNDNLPEINKKLIDYEIKCPATTQQDIAAKLNITKHQVSRIQKENRKRAIQVLRDNGNRFRFRKSITKHDNDIATPDNNE